MKPIEKINFTKEKLEKYYTEYFIQDMKRFFVCEHTDNGIEYVCGTNFQYRSIVTRNECTLLTKNADEKSCVDANIIRLPNGDLEDELMAVGMITAIYNAQKWLGWAMFRDNLKLYKFFKSMDFPLFGGALTGKKDVQSQLRDLSMCYPFKTEGDHLKYRELLELCFPFITEIIVKNLREWNDQECSDSNTNVLSMVAHFERGMNDTLFEHRRAHTPQKGLTGIRIDNYIYTDYLDNSFKEQCGCYFNDQRDNGYPTILSVGYHANHRLLDGQPGRTVTENFMFSVTILLMILAEKSIEKHASDMQADFHRACQWPLISVGPGGGYMIPAMQMLEEAGLAPSYNDVLYYEEILSTAEVHIGDRFNSIINGKTDFIVDPECADVFKNLDGRICKEIKQEFKEMVQQVHQWLQEKLKREE